MLPGDCVDLGESELPYVPLVAALRPLARSGDPALDRAPGAMRAASRRCCPGSGADRRPAPSGGDQARLFEGCSSVLDALGARARRCCS